MKTFVPAQCSNKEEIRLLRKIIGCSHDADTGRRHVVRNEVGNDLERQSAAGQATPLGDGATYRQELIGECNLQPAAAAQCCRREAAGECTVVLSTAAQTLGQSGTTTELAPEDQVLLGAPQSHLVERHHQRCTAPSFERGKR